VVTLYGGILNALGRFATAAAAPILLNLSIMAALALALFFPTPGHAAAWGVFIAGCLEVILLATDASRQGALPGLRWPRLDDEMKLFLKRFAPATAASAETQIALFADTIIASFLTTGAISALYYADRINQLPIGVIGIAAGTVLLPEMSRRVAAGDETGARHAQNRAVEVTLLLTLPCVVAFLMVPDLIMRALFMRGAFSAGDAQAAALTLAAYAIGLVPFVLMRSATITFLSRGDTVTPMIALAVAVTVNVACKIFFVFSTELSQVGLALATSIGAWVNLLLLLWLASRRSLITIDAALKRAAGRLLVASFVLLLMLWIAAQPVAALFAGSRLHDEATLAVLALLGAFSFGGVALALLGRTWLAAFRR
jgi:putative peptidoglycan lipid II flippase